MEKSAVIYTRVSTDTQADKGYSLRDQEDKLRRYCQHNDITIVEHFQDDYSAKDFNRPEWKLLIDFLKKNKNSIDLFMFAKWDRFSRNMEAGLKVLNQIKALGIGIHCLENNVDDSIPENKLIQTVMLLLPQIENERRSLSVIAGMRRAMKEGKWPRQAPIGYKNARDEENNKVIIPDPKTAPLIQYLFNEMAKGDKTQQEVRKEMLAKGLKCSKNNFSLLLRNPFYIGLVVIPEYKEEHETVVKGQHEAIVQKEVFNRVQDILIGRNRERNLSVKRSEHPELPLRGFIVCSVCGRKLTGSASKGNGGKYYYYHCNNCGNRFKADLVNTKFEKLLRKITLNDEVKELFLQAVRHMAKESIAIDQKEQSKVINELDRQKSRKERLDTSFLDGELPAANYTQLVKKLDQDIAKLSQKQKELNRTKDDFNKDLVSGVQAVFNLRDLYLKSDITDKRRIIGSIFPRKFIFEENKVRTEEMNEVIRWIAKNSRAFRSIKKGQPCSKTELSRLVIPPGFEPRS